MLSNVKSKGLQRSPSVLKLFFPKDLLWKWLVLA